MVKKKVQKKPPSSVADQKVVEGTNNGGSKNVCLLVTSVIVLLVGLACFQVYVNVIAVPDLPAIDFNEWWGPNTTKSKDTSIRPFRILYIDSMQEGLRRLFDSFRRRPKLKSLTENSSYGVHSDAFGQFFAQWQFKYPYRDRVRYLNKYEHFKTYIQGLDMHFVHVKPKVDGNTKVFPILLIHGWPSTFKDFYDVIPILTTPRPGYDFVFEVIVPSLPGYVYSQATQKRGLAPTQIAVILRNLMKKIGHEKFFIQGGDLGHIIGSHMATLFPDQVLGFHTNTPINPSKLANLIWLVGSIWPTLVAGDHADKMYPISEKLSYYLEESGYMHLQGTKPDTIGYVLQDSPVGLAAYMLDRYMVFSNSSFKNTEEGGLDNISSIDMLDNVMLYWITGSMTSAMRLYKESFASETELILARIPTPVPTWALRLKYELYYQPDWLLKLKYPTLLGTTSLNDGGHFAALEKPKELAADVFKAVKSFLDYRKK
ncbi:Juvenile hormone epoxide hydrolase [Papilio xuthus]|uniref:microsomal epoxide hydrolase n=1 Tax=Papilio xuthus TaxID=66420 RepID=A0A0N0P9P2_PAPXU|nr:Juvenile hormone epoxide hydrolase [Papilio xuthus]